MIKSIFHRPGAFLWVIFLWKIALLLFTAQPVPSNDAFFYDGPVVNFLLHGKYANPSIALALPISGQEVFCAYPPLYQVVLLGWMSVFGTSVTTAMVLHLVLFGIYLVLLGITFRKLQLPLVAESVASAFALAITFTDRPDSLAHVFGIAATYCWVSSLKDLPHRPRWNWAMVGFAVLSLCTGLQIGALYFLLLWIGIAVARLLGGTRLPIAPMAVMLLVPAALVGMIITAFPHLWTGFLEHARQTPAVTGLRIPNLSELLKVARTVPGILGIGIALALTCKRYFIKSTQGPDPLIVTLSCTAAGLVMAFASMFFLTPNAVSFAAYLQPVAVGAYLAITETSGVFSGRKRLCSRIFIALAVLGSVRAIGMTTWGVLCARDVSQKTALERVRQEITQIGQGQTAVFSGAYLHEAAPRLNFRWIHSDWLVPAKKGETDSDLKALISVRPVKLVLTQFDYYRRYRPVLDQLKSRPELLSLAAFDTAHVPTPDSIKPLQKVVQHISWAPIIVNLSWK